MTQLARKPISRRDGILATAITIISALAALFGVEFYLASDAAKAPTRASKALGLAYDARGMSDAVVELRRSSPGAAPAVWPGYLLEAAEGGTRRSRLTAPDGQETLPMAGVSRALTVMCREVGGYVTYESDRHGFNNPDAVWDKLVADIVLIGDSFAQGQCVPAEAQAAHLLRAKYPGTLALAMGHNGPLLELATLAEFGALRSPRAMIWMYYQGNDLIEDLGREAGSALLKNYLTPGFTQNLASRQSEIDALLRGYLDGAAAELRIDSLASAHKWGSIVRLRYLRRALGFGRSAPPPDWPTFEKILEETANRVGAWGGRPYFAYLPGWNELIRPSAAMASSRERVLATARAKGFTVIDLHARMASAPEPGAFFYYPASHYGPAGQRLLAEAILEALAADGLTPSAH